MRLKDLTFNDLTYWPRQHVLGFIRLWQFNGPGLAVRVTASNLLRVRGLVEVRLFGFTVTLRTGTPDLMVALDGLGEELAPVLGYPDPAGLIIDAGGYIGTAALRLARAYPRSRVICLEPAAENLAMLRRNVGAVGNIVVVQAALAATAGEATLHDPGAGEWGFSLLAGETHRPLGAVPTVTVEAILAHEERDRLFLLKLDVEGAESEILAASAGWIERTDILVAELHERLAPGVTVTFARITAGRINRALPGEKVVSVRKRFGGRGGTG
jgi:FkbM family methyltransferase